MEEEYGKEEESISLEEMIEQVEECIEALENPEITLEASFQWYEKGIHRLHQCREKVAGIEQQMLVLNSEYADEKDDEYAEN